MFRGSPGERGKLGDHGQDGRQGVDGLQGAPGKDGQDGKDGVGVYTEPEQLIQEAIASSRLRLWDTRLLILLALILLASMLVFFTLDRQFDRFRVDVVANCVHINEGNQKVNDLLASLGRAAAKNPRLTQEERESAAERYRGFMLPISDCPPA